eukprot:NODE_6570_length_502_cov_18.626932_g5787_i0.p1 GENE.NODE_6570_length_502_cov_18.626932_g5787_i0~~NODE_6570_length_502_cov_18.626932_g5787_i0.p1  ORF type:complete len:70 (-),score=4.69 NODE_6570_length_502_cov_18.626932_g5787_i0:140-349(-)
MILGDSRVNTTELFLLAECDRTVEWGGHFVTLPGVGIKDPIFSTNPGPDPKCLFQAFGIFEAFEHHFVL